MIMCKFTERLKQLQEEKGYKNVYMARLLNVTPQCYAQWRRGRSRPGYEELAVLAEIFYTTTDYLIGATDERNRKCLTE